MNSNFIVSFPLNFLLLKRLIAILFLTVLVFNLYGYKLVLFCLQTNNDIAIEKQVDKKQYNDDELISIKTTLHLPYYTSSSNYESAYGSISIDGKDYEYVKRRVYHDTLEVLCLPNGDKTKLKAVSNEITKATTDGQATTPTKKGGTTLKISLPDFCQSSKISSTAFSSIVEQNYPLYNTHLLPVNSTSRLERPPQPMPA